jgi:Flp pilus assembly protein TadG
MIVATTSMKPRTNARRGAAAAEFALIAPLLVMMVLGATDFGRFAYNYIAVTNAARAGASSGSMNNFTSSSQSTWSANVTQAARDEMTQQVGAANVANLTVTAATTTDGGLKRVQVTASYPFTTLVNWQWTGLDIPHTMNMQRKVEMRIIR